MRALQMIVYAHYPDEFERQISLLGLLNLSFVIVLAVGTVDVRFIFFDLLLAFEIIDSSLVVFIILIVSRVKASGSTEASRSTKAAWSSESAGSSKAFDKGNLLPCMALGSH